MVFHFFTLFFFLNSPLMTKCSLLQTFCHFCCLGKSPDFSVSGSTKWISISLNAQFLNATGECNFFLFLVFLLLFFRSSICVCWSSFVCHCESFVYIIFVLTGAFSPFVMHVWRLDGHSCLSYIPFACAMRPNTHTHTHTNQENCNNKSRTNMQI